MCKKFLSVLLTMGLFFSVLIPFDGLAATYASPTDTAVTGTLYDAVVTADPATNIDGLNLKSAADNLVYNIATNAAGASDYSRVADAAVSTTSSSAAINTNSFYKVFDGTLTTPGAFNMYGTTSVPTRVPAAVALDLGSEQYFNHVLVDASSSGYDGKTINAWQIKINNTAADFSGLKAQGSTGKTQVSGTNWKSIFSSTTKLGYASTGNKQEVKVGFDRIVKSRYVMLYISSVTPTNATFNMYLDELAIYLRDIAVGSGSAYSVDYAKKLIKVDDFDTAENFLANFTKNDANLSAGVFADAAAVTAVTGDVTEGNYLVTYFDNAGVKEIVSAYKISKPIPEIKNLILSGNPEIDSTLSANYDFTDENGNTGAQYDASTFQWYRDGVEIAGATAHTYKVTTADVGKNLTATATPVSVNQVVGVPVNSEAASVTVAGMMGGNLLVNKTVTNIQISGKNADGSTPGAPTVDMLQKMLNGYLQDVTINTGNTNAKIISFDVQLGSARVVNRFSFQSYTDSLTLNVTGLLNGSETGLLASKSNGMDTAVNIVDFTPTRIDTLRFQVVMPATTYSAGLKQLRAYGYVTSDDESVALEKAALTLPEVATENLTLHTAGGAYTSISWTSDNEAVLSADGVVNRRYEDVVVSLTATITRNNATDIKTFAVAVPKIQVFSLGSAQFTSQDGSTVYKMADDIADLQSTVKGLATLTVYAEKAQPGMAFYGRPMVAHYRNNKLTKLFAGEVQNVTITQEAIDAGQAYTEDIAVAVDLSAIDGGFVKGDTLKFFVWSDLNSMTPLLTPSVLEFNDVALEGGN